jgi:hypothetical protein
MSRDDLKDILCRVIENLSNDEAPEAGCLFGDQSDPDPCDVTTRYAVGEEG